MVQASFGFSEYFLEYSGEWHREAFVAFFVVVRSKNCAGWFQWG